MPWPRLPYQAAKLWAQAQNPLIGGAAGWRLLSKAKLLPEGMPAWPPHAYGENFESWGAFLGTGTVAATRRSFLPYGKTKAWARRQHPALTSKSDWAQLVRAGAWPLDIPTDPRNHYQAQFEGWGKFLGTAKVANQCRALLPYQDLRAWVRAQSPAIHSRGEYHARVSASGDLRLPLSPLSAYGKAFEGWQIFLGLRSSAQSSLIERLLRQELASIFPVDPRPSTRLPVAGGKKTQVDILVPDWGLVIEYDGARFHAGKEDVDRAKTRAILKSHPGWMVVRVRERPLRKLSRARDVVVSQDASALEKAQALIEGLLEQGLVPRGYRSVARAYLRRKTLAMNPEAVMRWRPYSEARTWAHAQSPVLCGRKDWAARCAIPGFLPPDIPAAPPVVYGDKFAGWGDFLGTGWVHTLHRRYRSYEKASQWAKKKGVATSQAWSALSATGGLPKDIPSNPNATYKSEWKGWGAFLGTGAMHPRDRKWRSLDEVKEWAAAQTPPVSSMKEWMAAKDRAGFPGDIPKCLYNAYGEGFEGFPLFINKCATAQVSEAYEK